MAGIIMDFEGRPVDTLSDAIHLVRDITAAGDDVRGRAFRDAWRAADPNNADNNLVYVSDWAYKKAPEKTRQAMHLLGVTRTVYGDQAPADRLQDVWLDGVHAAAPSTLEEAIQIGVVAAEKLAGSKPESDPSK